MDEQKVKRVRQIESHQRKRINFLFMQNVKNPLLSHDSEISLTLLYFQATVQMCMQHLHIWRKKIIRSQRSIWSIYSTLPFLFAVTIQHMSCDFLQMCLKSMVLELQVKENNRFSFSYYVELEEIWTAESKKVCQFWWSWAS